MQYLDLADYLAVAWEVTGLELATVAKIADVGLADSALHAPMAGFGGVELYPALYGIHSPTTQTAPTRNAIPAHNKPSGPTCRMPDQ